MELIIHKNTPEIRQRLEKLGYTEAEVLTPEGQLLIDSEPWLFVSEKEYTCLAPDDAAAYKRFDAKDF